MRHRHILGLSGKDSLSAALLIKAHEPELWGEMEVFSTLTGADFPETLEWLNRLPALIGKEIVLLDGDLPSRIAHRSTDDAAFLPSQKVRYCTKESKIQPFQKWLDGSDAILYTGIRADEQRAGYKESSQIKSEFPLHKYGYNLAKVWSLILNLPEMFHPPIFYWPEMHELSRQVWREQGYMVGGELDDHMTYMQRVQLMSGRSRPNCFFCFNQRRYEVVWLYETHHDLFEIMMNYEKPGYSWMQGFPLSELTEKKRQSIKFKRAIAICEQVAHRKFVQESDGFEQMKSCGLFCGK